MNLRNKICRKHMCLEKMIKVLVYITSRVIIDRERLLNAYVLNQLDVTKFLHLVLTIVNLKINL